MAWLEREEADALAELDAQQLKPLLLSELGDVQAFAARLLSDARGLAKFRVGDWMELLTIDNAEILPSLCELMVERVSPERLDLAQKIELACPCASLLDRRHEAHRLIVDGGRNLGDPHLAGHLVEQHEIGERAANVAAYNPGTHELSPR